MVRKVYVEVTAKFDTEGNITPLAVTWEDGTVYEIDKIVDKRRAASLKAGGIGVRYTCRIRNLIYFMKNQDGLLRLSDDDSIRLIKGLLIFDTKRLLLLLNNFPQLAVDHFSARLKLAVIVVLYATAEIYKQAENCVCKHFVFKLFLIIQNILSVLVSLLCG